MHIFQKYAPPSHLIKAGQACSVRNKRVKKNYLCISKKGANQ